MFSNSKIFFWFLIFFIVGVFVRTLWAVPEVVVWVLMLAVIGIVVVDYKNRRNIFLFCCLFGLLFGICRTEKELKKIYPRAEKDFEGDVLVVKEPEIKEDYQQIVVEMQKSKINPPTGGQNDNAKFKIKEKFLINTAIYPSYQYGELLNVKCHLENPENKYEKFDYIRYLAKDGIYQICKKAEIQKIPGVGAENFPPIRRWKTNFYKHAYKTKLNLEQKIGEIFSQPEGSYLTGLLIGGSSQLPAEIQENFRRTGTTHTVAVSGYNITIIAEFLMTLAIFVGFWRQKAFWVAFLGIVFFVLMIGSQASAVRAAVMGILMLWAAKKGRLANSVRAIVFAGAVMIWFSPLIFFYDVGFQLSFLATLGIVLIYGFISEKLEIKNDFLELKSIFLTSIAAQIGVFGILIYTFESFSPMSFLANLLILPAIPFIMLAGFLVIVLGFLFLPLAKLLALPVWLTLHLELKIVGYLATFKWAMVEIKRTSWIWLAIYYFFVVFLIAKLKYNRDKKES